MSNKVIEEKFSFLFENGICNKGIEENSLTYKESAVVFDKQNRIKVLYIHNPTEELIRLINKIDFIYQLIFSGKGDFKSISLEMDFLENFNYLHGDLNGIKIEFMHPETIKKISLSGLNLEEIPISIGQCINLEILDLSSNTISDLDTINKLKNLLELDLSNTNVSTISLSKNILNFPKLNSLSLANTNLNKICNEISEMKELSTLNLRGNGLSFISEELTMCEKLQYLDLSDNDITDIPSIISNLKNIKELKLFNNNISDLPNEISSLNNLKYLYLSHNKFESVNYSICMLHNIKNLDLSNNKIREISSFIVNLEKINILNLTDNNISILPDELFSLVNLTNLDLSSNIIHEIPEKINNLKSLEVLSLSNNQIKELPNEILQLVNLEELLIAENKLKKLPSCTYDTLEKLEKLDISNNLFESIPLELEEVESLNKIIAAKCNLSDVPKSFLSLKNLKSIDLSFNNIQNINENFLSKKIKSVNLSKNLLRETPLFIKKQIAIIELNLSGNSIEFIPTWIKKLQELRSLDFSNNKISSLPKDLAELDNIIDLKLINNNVKVLPLTYQNFEISLDREFSFNFSKTLHIQNNPLISPPLEILKGGKLSVKSYFEAIEEGEQKLNELKIIFVGDGSSGKTSLIKRLIENTYSDNEPQTHGVRIKDYMYKDIKLHFWDFGGQDVMHSTHQFFLSKRSIYVLLLDNRKDEEPEYWLKMIKTFGGDAPVFIILNKIDQNPNFQLNTTALSSKFPFIEGFHRISCEKDIGIDNFKNSLFNFIDRGHSSLLIDTPIPSSWMKIKDKFEEQTTNHKRYEDYGKWCKDYNIFLEHRTVLLRFLHELGTMLNFEGKENILKEYFVLNPRWVTDAAYKIVNSIRVSENNGILDKSDVLKILNEDTFSEKEYDSQLQEFNYTPGESEFILSLLTKFKLGFELEGGLLIPDLLNVEQVKFTIPDGNKLEVMFQYDFLPPSVMPQFIVFQHKEIKNSCVWRTGVLLESKYFSSWGLIICDTVDRKITITVGGENKREYLTVIRNVFESIHNTFENIKPELYVILSNINAHPIPYNHLKQMELEGDKYYRPYMKDNSISEKIEVKELLGDIKSTKDIEEDIFETIYSKLSVIEEHVSETKIEKEILMLQPNIAGLGVDIKALISKIGRNIKETNTFFSPVEG